MSDNDFIERALLAMREEVQNQAESSERIRVMFNAIANECGIKPVEPHGMESTR
jgi:hypothetical protein